MNTEIYKKAIEFYSMRGISKVDHINRVVEHTMKSCNFLQVNDQITMLTLVVALTYDMIDKKYPQDADRGARLIKEICLEVNVDEDLVLNIIRHVPLLEETQDWFTLLGVDGSLVRNIVSDADKLCALGVSELERHKNYIRETWPEISDEDVIARLRDYCEKKLFCLPNHIVFFEAKMRAEHMVSDMRARLRLMAVTLESEKMAARGDYLYWKCETE